MCGIVGVASVHTQQDRAWLAAGRDAMVHRGPDDAGEWWSSAGQVGFGHRRLSIVDLSPMGHQPMVRENFGLAIVFNGEIYNFRQIRDELKQLGYSFQSSSDTEVLLAAYHEWNIDCLTRFNGMFAFAIHDMKQKTVFLARDRAGEKPLFYYHNNRTVYFASELKGLFANKLLPRQLDPEALDFYLSVGYVPGDRCILKGYKKLPPAHAMLFNLDTGAVKVWKYWQLPNPPCSNDTASSMNESNLVDQLEYLLEKSVKNQLIADVPVGILLSGGVDSSLITAMAVRASKQVKTFTVGFPGHGPMDETLHARLIANYFGTNHTELQASAITPDFLSTLAHQFDEPIVDSSMIPTYLVSQLVRQHCTVALGGDGGDELFGGYGHYSRLLWMQDRLGGIPLSIRRIIAKGARSFLPLGYKGRNWLQALGADLERGLPIIASYLDGSTRAQLSLSGLHTGCLAEEQMAARVPIVDNLLERATRTDFSNYLPEDILVKVDRASMLSSLEIRAPFLDIDLVEFAFSQVPSRLKANARDKKILLKQLTSRVLPPNFDKQRKQGFSIPLANWLKSGPFRERFRQILMNNGSPLNLKVKQKLLDNQDKGFNNSERLFALVLFELWFVEHQISW